VNRSSPLGQDGAVTTSFGSGQPDAALPDAATTAALVDLAAGMARTAAALVRDGRPQQVDVAATKSSPVDVVTERDLASEALLRSLIAEHRPDDGVLGEEGDPVPGTSGRTWVLDPIDGTVNYLYGIPAYAVSVAVVAGPPVPERWTAVAGAVHSVADGRAFTAGRGMGAFCDGRQLRCNAARPLAESLVATGFAYTVQRRTEQGRLLAELLPHVRDVRRIGSAALDLCTLAAGGLDLYYERGLKPWDLAAAALVAAESGAVVTGLHGTPAGESMTVAGPTGSVELLLAFLEERGAASGS
jgi:myo-inositol-1(or 4)-monophosphatase